ncbi:MAG: hypothetical protein RBT64_14600, partial [Trichloromonas sp.]|nr:hypothetical protein [Trichloromonas sp.]
MQFPPVSLDSLLPATNAAAPPAAEGGGFAQALQTSESALRSPAADVPGKSPQQEKSLAGRGEGEARQASDDRGAGLASRERSAGAAVSPPGVNLPAVESLAGAATEAVPLPAEMAFAADFPAPEPVAATAPASPPTSEPPTSFIAPAGEPSRDAALLLSAPATVEPGKSVADLRAMPPERGASAPLPEPRVEGATTAIPKREDLHTAQQAAPAVNLASSDARMTASAVPAPEAAPHGETSGRTVLVEAAEATARGQADAPPRVSPPVSEFAGTRSAGGGDRAGAETVIAGALTSEGEPLSAGTNKSAIPAPAPEAPVPAGMKPEEAAPAVDLSGRAASPPPPEFRPPSAGGQAASAPAPEPPMPAGMKPEEAAPAVDLSGRAASPPPPEFRPPSAGGQAVS